MVFADVDIIGNEGAFGQRFPAPAMSGAADGLGDQWNVFAVSGHDGTTTDPSLALTDSAGDPSPVTFSIQGTVTGWSGAGNALVSDYLFLNAGNSDSTITWEISGLAPGEAYTLIAYGGVSRDIGLTLDSRF